MGLMVGWLHAGFIGDLFQQYGRKNIGGIQPAGIPLSNTNQLGGTSPGEPLVFGEDARGRRPFHILRAKVIGGSL